MAKIRYHFPDLHIGNTFNCYADICNKLFSAGYKKGARQRYGHAPLEFKLLFPNYGLWCPILSENGRPYKQWLNILEDNGKTIIEQNTDLEWIPDANDKKARVVFAGRRDDEGNREYVFLGVFERNGTKKVRGRKAAQYRRIATRI